MKQFFILLIVSFLSTVAFAQLENGYYRVKNSTTQRYLYVYDNVGEAYLSGLQVITDLDAIYLRSDLSNAISDPGSIVYVEKHGDSYDLQSQGTGVHALLNRYVTVSSRDGHYSVGATVSGVSVFLSDKEKNSTTGYGVISTKSDGAKLWDPIPVKTNTSNFFGVKPLIKANSKFYTSFFSSFGFKSVSSDTKVYVPVELSESAVLLKEVTNDIAPETPVVFECLSDSPSENKLDILRSGASVGGNLLKGVYFDTDNSKFDYAAKEHKNHIPTTSLHRVLSVNTDGKLVFATPSNKFHLANSAYLEVPASAKSELVVCFTKEEFDKYGPSSIDSIENESATIEIFNLLGEKVVNNENLGSGIYIIGGKKTIVR